jgi:hypothetical protein
MADIIPDSVLRIVPFFMPFNVLKLYDPNQDVLAGNPAALHKLLAEAIPALSHATGSNPIDGFGFPLDPHGGNIDLMTMQRGDGLWPNIRLTSKTKHRWLHGDFRDVAYFYNYKLYDDLVAKGNLK